MVPDMDHSTLPATVYLAFCAVEGGGAPLTAGSGGTLAVFSTPETLTAHTARRRVHAQVVAVRRERLAGHALEIDPA
jgi:hypothetical protein